MIAGVVFAGMLIFFSSAFRSALEESGGDFGKAVSSGIWKWPWQQDTDLPLTFELPREGEKVGQRTSVELKGTVPDGMHVWIFVYAPEGRYYGQGMAFPSGEERFALKDVVIGSLPKYSGLESEDSGNFF